MEGENTVGEARKLFGQCLSIIASKDAKYGSMWRTEDLNELWSNVSRKYEGLKHQYKEVGSVDMEFPLDLINYIVFFYLRLKNENK